MSEDYLWDRSGKPDPEIVRLEKLLGPLRYQETNQTVRARSSRRTMWTWAAVAAALLILGIAAGVGRMRTAGPVTSWQLSVGGEKKSAIRAGQVIETHAAEGATVDSELVGRVEVEPQSRLRLVSVRGHEERFALDRGVIHALIWAPPAQFVVDTPAAKAVDLGCQYTLQVGDDGGGFLKVESGWVAFQWRDLESFIPAGAACRTRVGRGPGTPYFLDAPESLTEAVRRFDLTGGTGALRRVLAGARQRDALTLWHLLLRTQGTQRGEVFDRFAALVTLPPGLERAAILQGDRSAVDAAWNALDLGSSSWWRGWKQRW